MDTALDNGHSGLWTLQVVDTALGHWHSGLRTYGVVDTVLCFRLGDLGAEQNPHE